MATANITRPSATGTERFVKDLTHHVFSGMTSIVAAANDGALRISKWEWLFPDGQVKLGGVVRWRPTASGTGDIKLTIYTDLGTTAFTTLSVMVDATPTSGTGYYIRSDGADSGGLHDGSANDSSHAYLTLSRAFAAWRNILPETNWGGMIVNANDTIDHLPGGGADGTHTLDPDYGPLAITRLGAGDNPVVNGTDTVNIGMAADGGHDAASLLSNPVVIDGIDFTWPSPQVDGSDGSLVTSHVACSYVNGVVTNASIGIVAADGFVAWKSTVTLSAKHSGFGISGDSGWVCLDHVDAIGNGDDPDFDHQIYGSSSHDVGILDSIVDQDGADAYSGIKTSNAVRVYCGRNTISNCKVCHDGGGNAGEEVTDLVIDSEIWDSATEYGIWLNYANRVSVRNVRSYGGISADFFHERSYSAGEADPPGAPQFVQNFQFFGLSINNLGGQFCNFTTSLWTGGAIGNCIVVKSGNGFFFTVQDEGDLDNLATDYNCYYRSGGTDGQNNFAEVNGVAKNFTEWKALILAHSGGESHSIYADPKYTAATDLELQSTSPCIGIGFSLGVITTDALDRPRIGPYAMGALQRDVVSGPPGGGGGGGGSVGHVHTLENTKIVAKFQEDATYGVTLKSIENLVDGAKFTFPAGPLFRLVLRDDATDDHYTTIESQDADAVTVQAVTYGTLSLGQLHEIPALGPRTYLRADFFFENFAGSSDGLKVSFVASILDQQPDRLLCACYFDNTFGAGMGSTAIFWCAPILLKITPFAADDYLIPMNGGLVTRNPQVDLIGDGVSYRFKGSAGFEPETKTVALADRMEVFYPQFCSTALAAYGDRGLSGAIVYLHDALHFDGRRILDTCDVCLQGTTIKLEHEGLVENGIAAGNGWSLSGDTDLRRVETYVRVFKRIGQYIGEEVGLDYKRWITTSPEGRLVLPSKQRDRDDMAALKQTPLQILTWGDDLEGETGNTYGVGDELRLAFPDFGAEISRLESPYEDTQLDIAGGLLSGNRQTASASHPGLVGDSVPDLFDLRVDAAKQAYATALRVNGFLSGGIVSPRRPTPYDGANNGTGVERWFADNMDLSRVRNHREAIDGAYKTTDQWILRSKLIATVVYEAPFTKVTLSSGAFDPSLWNLFTHYQYASAGIDHAAHQQHLGWVARSTGAWAFALERQFESNFKAASPIVYVAGDQTATILVGQTMILFFLKRWFIPGYNGGNLTQVGDCAPTSLCAMDDELGRGLESPSNGWGVRLATEINTRIAPWGVTLQFQNSRENLICWHNHGGERPGSNDQLIAWRRILTALRANIAQPFQILEDYGPYDWQVGLVDGWTKTQCRLDLTTTIGSWGASPFFQCAWGAFQRFGCYTSGNAGHSSNEDAVLGFYDSFYEGSAAKNFREIMVSDWMLGKLPTYGLATDDPNAIGVRPDGKKGFTGFFHPTAGMDTPISFSALMARLVQVFLNFAGINCFGQRLRSFERRGTVTLTSNLQLLAVLEGHNLPGTELGNARSPLFHSVMRDPTNPRRFAALFVNDSKFARGDSYSFRQAWYADSLPIGPDGYTLTSITVNPDGIVTNRVGFFHGDKGIPVALAPGQVLVLIFDFTPALKFKYAYDNQTLRSVPIPSDQLHVSVGDLHGSGRKMIYGFENLLPDQDWKISAADLRVFKMGQSESE